jgi:hypothetical protein
LTPPTSLSSYLLSPSNIIACIPLQSSLASIKRLVLAYIGYSGLEKNILTIGIDRIAGVLDFIHLRILIVTRKKKNKHDVSETGSVSVLR